ncbi:MAG: hypothetical protein DHS20C18_03450 [Saprospiraceae bacterium]|nr:MAG: hypothetical protein DHS20C18_03450 [Saprospiraceae bacterium]
MLKATHIVGGEMNYTCLGNDQYEITLTIFRDCFYGDPNAWFDDPASIGVFNQNNELLQNILVPLMNNDTLAPVLSSECLVVPPDVCVHTTTYRTTIVLPPISGGYQLAYQRCCRNQTIANIIDPLGTGATYGVTISERALQECNTNAKFQQWPPLYICVNEPILFDQSAIDIDGDSIVYKLCTPLQGASQNIPIPQPPNAPPYQTVVWNDPPYNQSNMLNGSPGDPPLQIDSQTGLLTGLPNTVGQFVVGICIEEYRDGELISTTRRDFQYNVGICGQSSAAFFAPEIQCGSLTVELDNQSLGAENYLWQFGDPNNPGFTSNEVNPVYSYADTGLYTITLITEPGNICTDTFSQEVYLQYASLTADFDYEIVSCTDSLTIQVTDLSADSLFDIATWSWELSPYGLTSDLQNPVFNITSGDVEAVLTLVVTAENGCQVTLSEEFFIEYIQEELSFDSIRICRGDSVFLNANFNENYTFNWGPSEGLSATDVPNPNAKPLETTTYFVTITDDQGCSLLLNTTVEVIQPYALVPPPDTVICAAELVVSVPAANGISFVWALDENFDQIISMTETAVVAPIGEETYYLMATDSNMCRAVESFTITGNSVNIRTIPDTIICLGETTIVGVFNLDPIDELTYMWEPVGQILSDPTNSAILVKPSITGPINYIVNVENQFGCKGIDSTIVTVIDTTSQMDFTSTVQCSGYSVQFASTSVNAPFFRWYFGDPANPGFYGEGASVEYIYPGPGTYELLITYGPEIRCPDTLIQNIVVEESMITPAFDWEMVSCGDTAIFQLTDQSQNLQSNIVGWQWTLVDTPFSDEQNPLLYLTESGAYEVTLSIFSDDGCEDQITEIIEIQLIDLPLPDSILICEGDSLILNPNGDPNLMYTWAPESLFLDVNAVSPVVFPTEDTAYSVHLTNPVTGCEVDRNIMVSINPIFDYQLTMDTLNCNLSGDLAVTSPESLDYLWANDPAFADIVGNVAIVPVGFSGARTFYLRMTDEVGCVIEDSLTLINGGFAINVPSVNMCLGDTAMLHAVDDFNGPLTYIWTSAAEILSDPTAGEIMVSPAQNSIYNLEAFNEFGCSATALAAVSVFESGVTIDISADPDTIFFGESTQLIATENLDFIYNWMPEGSLSDPNIFNPLASPEETTTYTLIVTQGNGCGNQALVTITVLNPNCTEPHIFIPNGFTPNGDGLNDELEVFGNSIDEMYLVIYNRWGQQVFEAHSQAEKWDGTFEGKALSPDVFGYYLRVNCFNGEEFFKKGNITLIK